MTDRGCYRANFKEINSFLFYEGWNGRKNLLPRNCPFTLVISNMKREVDIEKNRPVTKVKIIRNVSVMFYTVKNGKFKKILTLQRRTMELFICNSKICVRSFTTFHFRVTNWDFCGLYRCCFANEEWRLQKTQYFVRSSLFVARHYFSVYKHDTSFDAPGGGGGEGAGICGDSE